MECLHGEDSEPCKCRPYLPARLNVQQQGGSQGKKKNMKRRRGNISKGQGEVSEGKRVHFSLANTYLSFSLYQALSFAGKERIKTCMELIDSPRGEREMGPSHLDTGENFSAQAGTSFHEIPEGKEVHL